PLASKVPYQPTVTGEWVHRVVASNTVEAEHTGLVHTAPGHGPEDFDLGQSLGLPVISPVDERGHFTKEAGAYHDKAVKEADAEIIEDLRAANALFAAETLVHSYGHCWRCKTPILYRATVQWFLRVGPIKPKMIEEVQRIAWFPDWAGKARQMDWTRGWFNSQLAAGVVAFDRAPYDSVLMHGWVNGPDGRQMHKSLGNIIEPETIVRKFGVDALRFYMLSVNAIWEDKTFQEDGVRNANRTLNILWNVFRFATTYMVLDRFDPASPDFPSISGH